MLSSKPYWDDPLLDEFQVKVVSSERADSGYIVRIDKDVIRPEGGGQAGDRGTINGIQIVNTLNDEEGAFLVVEKPIDVGKEVTIRIDMEWRRALMRNHTAEHLLVSRLKGLNPTVKLGYIWIDGEKGTVDIEGDIDLNSVLRAEAEVQDIILRNLPVTSSIVPSSSLSEEVRAREGLESRYPRLRVVSIEGVDESACSGIHVLSTGDIGFFKVTDLKRVDSINRIHFLTHDQAISHVRQVYNEVLLRKDSYPFEMSQIGPVLDKAKEQGEKLVALKQFVTEEIASSTKSKTINGVRLIAYFLPGFDAKDLRMTLREIPLIGKSVILLFAPGVKCSFILWTKDMPQDASFYAKDITLQLGGKGGGSRDSFTGGFSNVQDPKQVFEVLRQGIEKKLMEQA